MDEMVVYILTWHHVLLDLTEQGKKAREPEMMALAYRLLEIQRLNIQLLIVFDGPARFDRKSGSSHSTTAASSASPGPSAEVEEVFDATGQSDAPDLIKELFRELGIPHTRAPGDCEAECCRMAELGIVDAVWSADSDCLMFGARTVLSRRTIAGSEPWHTCSVLEMDDVQLATGLTKRGAIIFAILKGCDYGRGLAGVSTDLALSIATKFPNLRESLPFLSRGSVSRWRSALWEAILSLKPDWETRPERDVFPTISFVHFCCQPIRSSDKALLSLPCIRTRWVELYGPSLRSTYDFIRELFRPLWRGTTPPRFALRILAAVELNNLLAFDAGSQDEKANSYSIIVKRRPKKTVQTSIIVRADAVFPNLAKECPNDFSKKPEQQLTIRLLDCILRKVLPAEALREKHPPREEDTSDEEIIPESIRRPPRGRKRKRTQIEGSSRVAQARDDSANRRYQNPSVSPQRPARKRFRGRLTGDDDRTEDDHGKTSVSLRLRGNKGTRS